MEEQERKNRQMDCCDLQLEAHSNVSLFFLKLMHARRAFQESQYALKANTGVFIRNSGSTTN